LQENDPQGFDDVVRKICPYYFDLEDIFGDCASTQPKILSTDNLDTSSESLGEMIAKVVKTMKAVMMKMMIMKMVRVMKTLINSNMLVTMMMVD
jgi:hypothetical protein